MASPKQTLGWDRQALPSTAPPSDPYTSTTTTTTAPPPSATDPALPKEPPVEDYSEKPGSVSSHNSHDHKSTTHGDDAKPASGPPEEHQYPPPKQAVVIMAAIMLAMFLNALDRTIIATAIPQLTDEFHSVGDIGWYGSAFLLTTCVFQLLLGKIYTFYTPKHVFLTLILIFEIGSAVCGAAPTSTAFIVGRAIAGLGAAGIISGAIILMTETLPLHKRPLWQGAFGATFGLASVLGPLVGGALTTNVSWRWCFYINLPIGAVVMVAIAFMLKPTPAIHKDYTWRQQLGHMDLLGQFFLFPCIICLLLALQWGGSTYAWSDGRIIALLTMFAVLFVAFALVQIFMQKTATLPASIILNQSIIAGSIVTFCTGAAMMTFVYYVPEWFQAIKGVSAVQSGIDSLPLVLSLVVASVMSGQIVGRIGYYTPFIYATAVLMPIGAGLISTFDVNTGEGMWIGYQIIFGFGLGLGMQQSILAAQTVLQRADVPAGVSVMFFFQTLSGAIFISVGQNLLSSHLVSNLTSLIKDISPETIVRTGATEIRNIVPADQLPLVLEAYNNALRQVFYAGTAMSALIVVGAAFMQWRSVKTKKGEEKHKPTSPTPEEKV